MAGAYNPGADTPSALNLLRNLPLWARPNTRNLSRRAEMLRPSLNFPRDNSKLVFCGVVSGINPRFVWGAMFR